MKKSSFILIIGLSSLMVSCSLFKKNEPKVDYPQAEEYPTSPAEDLTPEEPNVPSGETPKKGNYIVAGALPGEFHVSDNQTVHFSQGIAQFNPKKDEWRFAEDQNFTPGVESYGNISTSTDAWYSQFCWGQSGYNGNSITGGGYPSSMFSIKSIAGTKYDWGVFNAFTNGGNAADLWYCLSADEWDYLLKHHKHAYGSVDGEVGVFLIPDNFVCPENIPFVVADGEYLSRFSEHPSYTNYEAMDHQSDDNTFDATQMAWLEAAGLVFLPSGSSWYVTTTGSESYNDMVYTVKCSRSSIRWICNGNPKNGRYLVRLVQKL